MNFQMPWWKQVGGGGGSEGCEQGRPCGKGDPEWDPQCGWLPGITAGLGGGPKLDTTSSPSLQSFQRLATPAGLGESPPRGDCERRWGCPGLLELGTMNDVAIVKEGWLHKRGQCPRGRGGAGVRRWPAGFPLGGVGPVGWLA